MQRISDLPAATTLSDSDIIPVVQGGSSKKTTRGDILALESGSVISWYDDTELGRAASGVVNIEKGLAVGNTSPPALTGSVNNYNPGPGLFQRWSSPSGYNITGMTAGQDGELRFLTNVGVGSITITNQDGASLAANRFLTTSGTGVVLATNGLLTTIYDLPSTAWRVK